MKEILIIIVNGVLVHNFIMNRFLGCCPFLGVSKKLETAVSMGVAVTFVMTLASLITYLFNSMLLEPLGMEYLQILAFIVVIAALVQIVEMALRKISPLLYRALGVYLPLITTNCAVLGVTILNVTSQYNLVQSVVNGFAGGVGFMLAITLFAGVRERLELADMPAWMDGFPGALITAGLMSVAFFGFAGMG
ncbi:MAG: electron transport complex subunit RsxA [Oscillospiraceae bacterium]|jgi:electron transport complex protein RnfA|nr:electron transport complex subunit RsxA [Oscillospiraceae bacterium]